MQQTAAMQPNTMQPNTLQPNTLQPNQCNQIQCNQTEGEPISVEKGAVAATKHSVINVEQATATGLQPAERSNQPYLTKASPSVKSSSSPSSTTDRHHSETTLLARVGCSTLVALLLLLQT